MEVETPVLQEGLGDYDAKPFITHYSTLNTERNYLRIAARASAEAPAWWRS